MFMDFVINQILRHSLIIIDDSSTGNSRAFTVPIIDVTRCQQLLDAIFNNLQMEFNNYELLFPVNYPHKNTKKCHFDYVQVCGQTVSPIKIQFSFNLSSTKPLYCSMDLYCGDDRVRQLSIVERDVETIYQHPSAPLVPDVSEGAIAVPLPVSAEYLQDAMRVHQVSFTNSLGGGTVLLKLEDCPVSLMTTDTRIQKFAWGTLGRLQENFDTLWIEPKWNSLSIATLLIGGTFRINDVFFTTNKPDWPNDYTVCLVFTQNFNQSLDPRVLKYYGKVKNAPCARELMAAIHNLVKPAFVVEIQF